MAEQSSDNKKSPLIPPNFVTLVQLKERWNREQERKQREKEEQEKQQRREEEKKLKQVVAGGESASQRVKGEPINRRNRPVGQYTRRNQSRKPEELKVATVCVVSAIESAATDAETPGLKDSKKKKSWKGKRIKKAKSEDKVRAENENEEVIRGGENEEVIRGEEEAPSSHNIEKETVPSRRERRPRGAPTPFRPRIHGTSVNEIVKVEKKFEDLSVGGGYRRDHRYSRQRRYPNRGNSEFGRDYGRPCHPRERNLRNAGMTWVKKGEVGDGNVVEIQTSSFLPRD